MEKPHITLPQFRAMQQPGSRYSAAELDALTVFIKSGSANGNEAMRRRCLKIVEELRAPVSEQRDTLPGLRKALELCEQTRAYYETFLGRPLMAEQVWDIEVKMRAEIVREEARQHPAAQQCERNSHG